MTNNKIYVCKVEYASGDGDVLGYHRTIEGARRTLERSNGGPLTFTGESSCLRAQSTGQRLGDVFTISEAALQVAFTHH